MRWRLRRQQSISPSLTILWPHPPCRRKMLRLTTTKRMRTPRCPSSSTTSAKINGRHSPRALPVCRRAMWTIIQASEAIATWTQGDREAPILPPLLHRVNRDRTLPSCRRRFQATYKCHTRTPSWRNCKDKAAACAIPRTSLSTSLH